MANMRAIRTRIKSVKSTEQITKAMKMVAVSKLRRTQKSMQAMRPFAEKSREVMDTLLGGSAGLENRFITPHKQVKKVCYVLFVGNRGLCGAYNSAVLHYANELIGASPVEYGLVVCGRWGKDVIAHSRLNVIKTFAEISDTPSAAEALEIADYLKSLFLGGEYDEVHLVYQRYISALHQEPSHMQLLPAVPASEKSEAGKVFIFEPDAGSVLESVMQLYLNNTVMSVLLDAKCGEHSSRMTAMTSASDSTKKLISELDLKLNRARQAAITTEISEIVGGASALKKKKT